MGVETVVGLTEQFAVEALFTAPGFVSRNQEDALALRIEGKGYSPLAAGGEWRVAFAFDTKRKGILLIAGDKSGGSEKRFYRELLRKADNRFDASESKWIADGQHLLSHLQTVGIAQLQKRQLVVGLYFHQRQAYHSYAVCDKQM